MRPAAASARRGGEATRRQARAQACVDHRPGVDASVRPRVRASHGTIRILPAGSPAAARLSAGTVAGQASALEPSRTGSCRTGVPDGVPNDCDTRVRGPAGRRPGRARHQWPRPGRVDPGGGRPDVRPQQVRAPDRRRPSRATAAPVARVDDVCAAGGRPRGRDAAAPHGTTRRRRPVAAGPRSRCARGRRRRGPRPVPATMSPPALTLNEISGTCEVHRGAGRRPIP